MQVNMNMADALFMAWIAGMWHIAVFWAGYLAGQAQLAGEGAKSRREGEEFL